jgi:hypothetical protein
MGEEDTLARVGRRMQVLLLNDPHVLWNRGKRSRPGLRWEQVLIAPAERRAAMSSDRLRRWADVAVDVSLDAHAVAQAGLQARAHAPEELAQHHAKRTAAVPG